MKHLAFLVGLACLPFTVSLLSRGAEEEVKLAPEEQKILEWTNQARQKEKLPPLKLNPILTRVARAHSENMAAKGELNHVLDGKRPAQRVQAAGYNYRNTGENIAYSGGVPVEQVFDGWMNSRPHRENILRETYDEIGIGMARDARGVVYYTQVFGKQMPRR